MKIQRILKALVALIERMKTEINGVFYSCKTYISSNSFCAVPVKKNFTTKSK